MEGGKIVAVQAGADVQQGSGSRCSISRIHRHAGIVACTITVSHRAPDLQPMATGRTAAGAADDVSSPRLYSPPRYHMRTTGSVETYADLNLKQMIDAGLVPGPHIDVTGPYLEGQMPTLMQMHQLTGPDDARKLVNYWADQGVTSFKA